VSNIFRILLLLIFISSCSLDNKTGLWSKTEKIKKEKKVLIKEQFKEEIASESELNPNLKVNLPGKLIKNSFVNNLNNNNGQINYNGDLKKTSRFKFSKIHNIIDFEPEIVFANNNVIFFDNKGSILKFNKFSKLLWKKIIIQKMKKNQNQFYFSVVTKIH